MGQGQLKKYKRALRKTAQEEKNNIISDFVKGNWDQVIASSVAMIRRFSFANRFQIAMTILFKPDRKNKVPRLPKRKKADAPPPEKPAESA